MRGCALSWCDRSQHHIGAGEVDAVVAAVREGAEIEARRIAREREAREAE